MKVTQLGPGSYRFQADEVNLDYLQSDQFKIDGKGLRGSIMLVGPLLARFGKGSIPRPGGDKIGRRRLDTHFDGLIELGAKFKYNRVNSFYSVEAKELVGKNLVLDEASVTGTANIIMAAVLALGKTIIKNAAKEPEIIDLANCLRLMGAKIEGDGSSVITIEGVKKLKGCEYDVMPDRIETATFLVPL